MIVDQFQGCRRAVHIFWGELKAVRPVVVIDFWIEIPGEVPTRIWLGVAPQAPHTNRVMAKVIKHRHRGSQFPMGSHIEPPRALVSTDEMSTASDCTTLQSHFTRLRVSIHDDDQLTPVLLMTISFLPVEVCIV